MEFTDSMIATVWEKGRATRNQDPLEWRMDACGAWIHRSQYNNPDSEYGWRILNTSPEGRGDLEHLEPFHCRNEYDIANRKPHCHVTADRTDIAPTAQIDTPCNRPV